MKLYFDIKL